jgi:hypothetical protein
MIVKNASVYVPAVMFLIAGSAFATPAKGARCADVSIRVTMYNVVDPGGANLLSRIYSDGKGEYVNKMDGVSALIKVCDGTNSAVWSTGRRNFTFNFPLPISGVFDPSQPFAGIGPFLVGGWINVHNITYNHIANGKDYQPFTTRMGLNFTYKRTTYGMGFFPPLVEATDTHDPGVYYDEDSPAMVIPQAFGCTAANGTPKPSSWLARGNNPNVNGILQVGTVNPQEVGPHQHYSMPFEFLIEALTCY